MTRQRAGSDDRLPLIAGAIALAVIGLTYPLFADAAGRPLAVFVLPCLLTAGLGRWRPTVVVGLASLAVAVVYGLTGPLATGALAARWLVIAAGVVMGAIGAAVREHESGRIADLDETVDLLAAFELGLAPSPLPPPGFLAIARYEPAESRMQLGGDFLEAIALGDHRLAVLIGDVCGHGPREAAIGAALRAGWKSIALSGRTDPVEWVDALDHTFFRDGRITTFVTLCTGYLDLCDGVIRMVNAGHPAPIALQFPAKAIDIATGPPLGLGYTDVWSATERAWGGEPVLLYTDGLLENPRADGLPNRWSQRNLLAWLDGHRPEPTVEHFVDGLVAAATTDRDRRDDVALLLVASAEPSAWRGTEPHGLPTP